jgi:hypothetical protein
MVGWERLRGVTYEKGSPLFPLGWNLIKPRLQPGLHKTTINTNKLGFVGTRSCSGLATLRMYVPVHLHHVLQPRQATVWDSRNGWIFAKLHSRREGKRTKGV